MATASVTIKTLAYPSGVDYTQRSQIINGTFTISHDNYATNGLPLVWTSGITDATTGNNVFPLSSQTKPYTGFVAGLAGYVYSYDVVHNTLRIYQSAAATPAGTISAPTITTGTNATTTTPVYTNGGALTQVSGAAGITGVQAPTFTGSAQAAAALAELANGVAIPAACYGDTISFQVWFAKD